VPDRVNLLARADAAARLLRRMGLRPLTRAGREMLRRFMGDELQIVWEGFSLTGRIEHRGYLATLRAGNWERGTIALLRSLVRPGGVFVDVGAYIGAYTLLAGRVIGAEGRAFAFEPDPRTLPALRRNVLLNGLEDVVRVLDIAAADQNGWSTFYVADRDASTSSLIRPPAGVRGVPVQCARLDDVLRDEPSVDVMKVDVEGAEVQVLEGAREVLARSPHLWLVCEVNPTALKAAGATSNDLLDILGSHGFTVRVIQNDPIGVQPLPRDWSRVKYVNVLAHRGDWSA
jgi:FkbM family methyltransferase